MDELKVVYLSPEELKPYENNTRKHAPKDIEQIKESILQDGFNDPIGIWGPDNLIVEGHGRQLAAIELHLEKVPCIRLDHLTDDQRRDYAIRHNRTAELSEWDVETLMEEIAQLEIEGHDLAGLDFDFGEGLVSEHENPYTQKTDIPQYQVTGEDVPVYELYQDSKTKALIEEIEAAEISPEAKDFLKIAAYRHVIFHYQKIAEYYAKADKDVQRLMEKSALVIIDIDDAIANGYTLLKDTISELVMGGLDYDDE